MWLPLGSIHSGSAHRCLLLPRAAMVCGGNRPVHDSCQLPENGIGVRCSRRKAAVLGGQGTTSDSHCDLRFDRSIGFPDTDSEAHPDAHPVRGLSIYGNLFPPGISSQYCPSTCFLPDRDLLSADVHSHPHILHASQVPAGFGFSAPSSDRKGPFIYGDSISMFRLSVGRQVLQTYIDCIPAYGRFTLRDQF